ncbi:MAG: PD-(D/E)XK nuclease family protein [Halioglobus sp.]|nr:PD-(D/E)XK nuclease family protein [Halioglobus sp.]
MANPLYDITPLEPLIQSGYTLLTPNRRLARRIKIEWDRYQVEAGKRAWSSLRVFPLEQWLISEWQNAVEHGVVPPRRLLPQQQALLLWQDVIARHAEAAGGPILLHSGGAAEHASNARDLLLRYRLDTALEPNVALFKTETDCATFLQWEKLFEQHLAETGCYTNTDALVALADQGRGHKSLSVVLIECGELTPLVAQCLNALCNDVQELAAQADLAQCIVHPFPDSRAEMRGVAAWAACVQRESPSATVGIVSAGSSAGLEYLLRREFDCLGDNFNSLPVNYSTGISLVEAPVVRDALAVLTLGLEQAVVGDVVALLRSRFLKLPDAESALSAHFVSRLFDAGSEQLATRTLANFANSVKHGDQKGLTFGRHLAAVLQMRELRRPALPSQWITRFETILGEWGWPGPESLDSLEYQQVARWYDTLEEYRALDSVRCEINFAEALRLLREICRAEVSHPSTTDSPVQVLGPLEAVGLAFDHLWICGMQAAKWPASPSPNPFIPVPLQAGLQMPHACPEREWRFVETLFEQYRRASATVHASYSRQIDGVNDLPSPLLKGFPEQEIDGGEPVFPEWKRVAQAADRETVRDNRAPQASVSELAGLRGGAALIEHQSHCPFRAFAQHRLHAQTLATSPPGISNAERGQIVHGALQCLWSRLDGHSELLDITADQRASLIDEAARVGLESVPLYRRIALGNTCLTLESHRLESLLQEWLTLEAARGEFVVQATEEDIVLQLDTLVVRLRVDRIDQLPDGSQAIIDYKTGQPSVSNWLGERPAEPQLLLYGLATGSPPAVLAFAQVRPGACRYIGVGDIDTGVLDGIVTDIPKAVGATMRAHNWQELNREWAENLRRLAQDFVEGEATVDPLAPKSCLFCGMQSLCRVNFDDSWEEDV